MKIEFEIIQKIKIKPISEAEIKKILIAEIQKQIPEATINGVEFITKRNPTRVELEVDAQYGDSIPEIATKVADTPKTEPVITMAAVDKAIVEEGDAHNQVPLELVNPNIVTEDKDELIASVLEPDDKPMVKAKKVPAALTGDVAKMFEV